MKSRPESSLRAILLRAAVCALLLAIAGVGWAQEPLRPTPSSSTSRRSGFSAVNYDVYVSLFPQTQSLTGKATVEFQANQASRIIECQLHPNLRLSAVRDASGRVLDVERDEVNSLIVRVTLPNDLAAGQRAKVVFEYSGILANDDGSPAPGIRLAHVAEDGSYLLQPARWFPLTGYPSNRYTGVFHIEVPQDFTVAGTGVSDGPTAAAPSRVVGPQPASASSTGRVVYSFRVDTPEAAGTFVAGALKLTSAKAQGLTIPVYAPATAAASSESYGETAARIISDFSDQFGALPQPNLTVAQLPDGSLESFAAPGFVLVSQRQWGDKANEPLLAEAVAAQWWGNQVMAATPSDAWLTDGLARYSEALYVEEAQGKGGMDKLIDQFAVGALMYEGSMPIAEAGRLAPYSPDYNSVVVNKGAMVFHMLRGQMGDSNFLALLRDFFTQYSGKAATLADFEQLARSREAKTSGATSADSFVLKNDTSAQAPDALPPSSPPSAGNLGPFFAQWLHSNGIPEFNLTYTVYRTRKGFRILGKVEQNLDFFNMPVELEVRTEGNPELKTIQVTGLESSFETEVFGRPRPGGIILDPHNYILKSSPALHIRAMIARGEALAEQGRFFDALQQYSAALNLQHNNSLAEFRTGEAFFYQRNYSAAANSFRAALDGDLDPVNKWVEVWSHIYLGKIYDVAGDRTRAVNEYSKAQQTNDDTGGAQSEAKRGLQKPYTESTTSGDAVYSSRPAA